MKYYKKMYNEGQGEGCEYYHYHDTPSSVVSSDPDGLTEIIDHGKSYVGDISTTFGQYVLVEITKSTFLKWKRRLFPDYNDAFVCGDCYTRQSKLRMPNATFSSWDCPRCREERRMELRYKRSRNYPEPPNQDYDPVEHEAHQEWRNSVMSSEGYDPDLMSPEY